MNNIKIVKTFTNDEIYKLAPSVFAQHQANGLTDKYTFVPTIEVVDVLRGQGWEAVKAAQSRSKTPEGVEYAKHIIRFQNLQKNSEMVRHVGDIFPELILTNSHDGRSSFQIDLGLFRLACSNGLTVSAQNLETQRIRHVGYDKNDVIEATYKIVENIPQVIERITDLKSIQIDDTERVLHAISAVGVRYGDNSVFEKFPPTLIRRREDADNTLWNSFNSIQECLIKGGTRAYNDAGKRTTARGIKSITEDLRINRELWAVTEKLANYKKEHGVIDVVYKNGEFVKVAA